MLVASVHQLLFPYWVVIAEKGQQAEHVYDRGLSGVAPDDPLYHIITNICVVVSTAHSFYKDSSVNT